MTSDPPTIAIDVQRLLTFVLKLRHQRPGPLGASISQVAEQGIVTCLLGTGGTVVLEGQLTGEPKLVEQLGLFDRSTVAIDWRLDRAMAAIREGRASH